jgi:hypothetical protein
VRGRGEVIDQAPDLRAGQIRRPCVGSPCPRLGVVLRAVVGAPGVAEGGELFLAFGEEVLGAL